ncbi:hypothetical protein [Sphingomonas sp.]|uniref:hypothetical protein n=1 Tax=Sphingomonas sp. TaxID=28214 RepID=UPI0025D289CA|nr:hypothetical protein [Sphingomonas sp.]
MNPIPFPKATAELRRAWANDVDAALSEAEGLLHSANIPLDRRIALKVDIGEVRAALASERRLLGIGR